MPAAYYDYVKSFAAQNISKVSDIAPMHSIHQELDGILEDLNRINLMVAGGRDPEQIKEIYLKQEGSESYSLQIDKTVFYMNLSELIELVRQIKDLKLPSDAC